MINTELPAFAEGMQFCPKCGWDNGLPAGLPPTFCTGLSWWPVNTCSIRGEHVHRVCNRCKVNIPQQCKDKTVYRS